MNSGKKWNELSILNLQFFFKLRKHTAYPLDGISTEKNQHEAFNRYINSLYQSLEKFAFYTRDMYCKLQGALNAPGELAQV